MGCKYPVTGGTSRRERLVLDEYVGHYNMHVRTADFGSTLQMVSSAGSAARSDVARGWADYFVSTHARGAWLLHEYLHPTTSGEDDGTS